MRHLLLHFRRMNLIADTERLYVDELLPFEFSRSMPASVRSGHRSHKGHWQLLAGCRPNQIIPQWPLSHLHSRHWPFGTSTTN